ncbi:MAG TPA: hypothetical protein DDY54_00530 [Deltaproteobacteria bacterium]|nr:hypothetical protein [Deltaproteobacteria bacterium]
MRFRKNLWTVSPWSAESSRFWLNGIWEKTMNQIVTCLSAMMRAKGQSASEQPRTFVPPKKLD